MRSVQLVYGLFNLMSKTILESGNAQKLKAGTLKVPVAGISGVTIDNISCR